MRRIFSILLSIYFLYNIIGYYPIFLFQQNKIEKEIKQMTLGNFPNDIVTIITFRNTDLQKLSWLKENEFIYKDKLYDVIKRENGNDGETIFYCVEDHKEKDLIVQFEKHLASHMDNESGNQANCNPILKKLNNDFYFFEFDSRNYQFSKKIDFINTDNFYCSAFMEQHTPPPKYL